MATQFKAEKIDFNNINNGNEFENGDGIDANAINAPIKASAYAQEVAEQALELAQQGGGSGGGGEAPDLSEYVKKTDVATNAIAGLIIPSSGLSVNANGEVKTQFANNRQIDNWPTHIE